MKTTKELRDKTSAELEQKLYSLKEQLFNLNYQAKTGRLEKPDQIRKIKKDVARILTISKERQTENEKKSRQ